MNRAAEPDFLCQLAALGDPGSAAFVVEWQGTWQSVMVLRKGEAVFGYLNSCPHIGAPLDWQPGQFLDADKQLILCAVHGALFRIEDGECLGGPCAGKRLTPVPLRVEAGLVRLDAAAANAQ